MIHSVHQPQPGLNLHVEESGATGVPVIFQHGLCGDAAQPAEVFPDQPAFRRITMECRGHGRSDAGDVAQFSIAHFTDDFTSLITTRKLGPVIVGGISMGAAIAMRLAVARPDLIRALIIARPAWSTEPAPPNMQPNAEVGRLMAQFPPDQARAEFLAGATAKRLTTEAPDNLKSLTGLFSREPFAMTSELLQRISADGPGLNRQQLRAITIPTLVMGHQRDEVHPFAMAREIADLIPTARLVEVTPKATNKSAYVAEFQHALFNFLKDFT